MLPTRLVFHAMLGAAIAIAVSGIALGVQAGPDRSDGSSHTAAAHRSARDHIAAEEAVAPPLPVSPRFGAEVAGRPVLAWHLEEGTDGARVELSPTNDFDEGTLHRIDVRGEKLVLPASWPSGVWYWRLRGRDGSIIGDRTTPTWMLYVADASTAS
jgi:hypothetical protein